MTTDTKDDTLAKLTVTLRRIAWCKQVGKDRREGKSCGRYYRRLCRRRDRLTAALEQERQTSTSA